MAQGFGNNVKIYAKTFYFYFYNRHLEAPTTFLVTESRDVHTCKFTIDSIDLIEPTNDPHFYKIINDVIRSDHKKNIGNLKFTSEHLTECLGKWLKGLISGHVPTSGPVMIGKTFDIKFSRKGKLQVECDFEKTWERNKLEWKKTKNSPQHRRSKSKTSTKSSNPSEVKAETLKSTSSNRDFIGRKRDIRDLMNLVDGGHRCIQIVGESGMGKTTLAEKFFEELEIYPLIIKISRDKTTLQPFETVLNSTLENETLKGNETLPNKVSKLQEIVKGRIGLIVNDLQTVLDESHDLITTNQGYSHLIDIFHAFVNTQSICLITSNIHFARLGMQTFIYTLNGLKLSDWTAYFSETLSWEMEPFLLKKAYEDLSGSPQDMKLLLSQADKKGKEAIEDYITNDLHTTNRFEFRKESFDSLSIELKALISRMGAFRFPNCPSVKIKELKALLWDIEDDSKKICIINTAIKHPLITEKDGGGYELHQIVQKIAIEHLKRHNYFDETKKRLAKFYLGEDIEKSLVSREEILKVVEAFHHYFEIEEYEEAAKVLTGKRESKFASHTRLGVCLYRIGELQLAINLIDKVLPKVNNPLVKMHLFNILGDCQWLTGNIMEAKKSHKECLKIAEEQIRIRNDIDNDDMDTCKRSEIHSYYNLGLCNFDLWEIEEAIKNFIKSSTLSHNCNYPDSDGTLAYIYSCDDKFDEAKELMRKCNEKSEEPEQSFEITNEWGRGYYPLFKAGTYMNLGYFDKAKNYYDEAEKFATSSNYRQVEAKCLVGYGNIERLHHRQYPDAIKFFEHARDIFAEIGAVPDLADALLQLALAYKLFGNEADAIKQRDLAIDLYNDINAPEQIKRVNKEFNCIDQLKLPSVGQTQ